MIEEAVPQALIAMPELITAGIGFAGVVVGSILSFWITSRGEAKQSRRDLTIALYHEFHSETMTRARGVTYNAIVSKKGQTFDFIYNSVPASGQLSLSMYMHFLEKVAILDKERMLDKHLLKNLLGRYFYYWFGEAINKMCPEPPQSDWYHLMRAISRLSEHSK